MDRPCNYGKVVDMQKDCKHYSPRFKEIGKSKAESADDWRCFYYRPLGDLHWCDGMYERDNENNGN